MLGRAGLERLLEDELAGKDGFFSFCGQREWSHREQRESVGSKSNAGYRAREDPKRGFDIHLTVDGRIQRILTRALSGKDSGAAIVLDVQTGAVLGIVSKPTFDPNIWSGV